MTVSSAEHAFQVLKSNIKIQIAELQGMSGLLIEQVQVFERIRESGGMITQKGKYLFCLLKTCGTPLLGTSWDDYQKLFLTFITEKNEVIEIVNTACEKDVFLIQSIQARR